MTSLAWPTISCWLAADLAGLRDKRQAILGDFLALAQDGHVDVTASADRYTLHRTSEQPPDVPFERAELLAGLLHGPDCYLLRADATSDLIGLTQLREAGRRSAAAHAFTRPVFGLTAAGKAQRQRVRDLPAQLHAAHDDPRAVPWARLFLDDDAFLGWYRAHLAETGPPAWLLWSDDLAPETTNPMAPQGLEGLFEVLLNAIAKTRRSNLDRPASVTPAEPAAPPPSVAPFLRARAAAGADAAAGVTDADAARDLLERLRDGGDQSAVADAEERLLALIGTAPDAEVLAWAGEVVGRREALAGSDPQRHGPLLGVVLTLHAHLLLGRGRGDEATATAERAIAVLGPYADQEERVGPALVLAHDAVAAVAFEASRFVEAERAVLAGTELLRRLAGGDPGLADDLAHHEALLADEGLRIVVGPGIDQVNEKLAEGIRLSRLGQAEQAVRPLAAAMEMSALLTDPDADPRATTRWDRAMLRRSGRAHWRYVVAMQSLGRLTEALDAGQRAIWCYQTANDASPAGSAEPAEHAAEFMTVLTDVAEAAAGVGETEMSMVLIAEGIRLGTADRGADQAVLRAYGTLLHNKASTMTDAIVTHLRAGRPAPYPIGEAGAAIAEAADIRERLAGLDVLAAWELANTLLLATQIAALTKNGRIAVEMFCRAGAICAQLGPAADALADRLQGIGAMLVAMVPEEVAAARSASRWPLA